MTARLSSPLCAFEKGDSAQHAVIRPIEAVWKVLDKKGVAGMNLKDLSKMCDWIPHDLSIYFCMVTILAYMASN